MPGSHWVKVCISDSAYAEYFDSHSSITYKLENIAFLQRHSISWTLNSHKLHGLTSNGCGHYFCIYALQSQETVVDAIHKYVCDVRYIYNDKKALCMFRSLFRKCPCCRRFVQQQQSWSRRYNKGKLTHYYQSAMSLLVIDFTFLERRDGEVVVKELTAVDSHSNMVSS